MTGPSDPTSGPAADGAPALPAEPTRTRPSPARSSAAGVPPSAAAPDEPIRTEPSPDEAAAAPGDPAEPRRRPWAWIAVCAVLALAVVGVAIWALSLRSDLDRQREQTAAAQQDAQQAADQADKLSSQVDQLTQDVNDAVDQAGQAGAAAKQQLQGALADLKDRLGALAGQTKPPSQGSGSPAGTPTPTATAAAASATATAVENATPGAGG